MDRMWKSMAAVWLLSGMCFGLVAGEQFTVEVIQPSDSQKKFTLEVQSPVAESPSFIVVAYTTQFCGPCNRWKATEKDKLRLAGVRVEYLDANNLTPEWAAWVDKARRDYNIPITTVPHFFVLSSKDRTLMCPPLSGFKSAMHLISVGTRRNFMAPATKQAVTRLSCEEIRERIRGLYSPRQSLAFEVTPPRDVWRHITDGTGGTHTYRSDQVSCLALWEALALHDDAHKKVPEIRPEE